MGEKKYLDPTGLAELVNKIKSRLLDELHITSVPLQSSVATQIKNYVESRIMQSLEPKEFRVVFDIAVSNSGMGNIAFNAGDAFTVYYSYTDSTHYNITAILQSETPGTDAYSKLRYWRATRSGISGTSSLSECFPNLSGYAQVAENGYDYIDNFEDFITWLKAGGTDYPYDKHIYIAQLDNCPIESENAAATYSGMLVGSFHSSGGPYVFTGHLIGNNYPSGEGYGEAGKEYNVIITGGWWDTGDLADGFNVKVTELLSPESGATYFLASPATFVVNSNETLAAWANHTAGNDYTSVYIASGTYTLASGGINLTAAGTKQIEGHPSSKLIFNSLTPVDGNYSAALYYTTRPTDPTYSIKNVNVVCTGAAATSANNYPCGFRNCLNLSNCSAYARATGTKQWQAAYGYYACQNLYNCFGAASGCNNGNAYTFAASSYLTNCVADETTYPATYDPQADIIPYASCSYLVNCVSKAKNGYELTRGFFGCSYLTGCHAEMTQDASTTVTEISGFNRCSRISNCHAKITDNSGKTLTNIGGFINSTMIDNCTSEGGQIYNSSYVAKCNATAYTQSYSDDYVTAAADTAAGGWNHTGILTWKNNRWENA